MKTSKKMLLLFSISIAIPSFVLLADGFNPKGFDRDGFNKVGFNKKGFDKKGFDIEDTPVLYIGGIISVLNLKENYMLVGEYDVYFDNLNDFTKHNNLKIGDKIVVVGTMSKGMLIAKKVIKAITEKTTK
jgi:hypothetical protein